jgi:hypothetical protein
VVFHVEESPADEPIEMKRGERSPDLDRGRGAIPIDRLRLPDDVLVQPPTNGLPKQGKGVQLAIRLVIHRWNCIACGHSRKT